MVLQIILADILLVARIFPRPCGARKNTTQLVKYPRVLSVKPSNKVYTLPSGLLNYHLSLYQKTVSSDWLQQECKYMLRLQPRDGYFSPG